MLNSCYFFITSIIALIMCFPQPFLCSDLGSVYSRLKFPRLPCQVASRKCQPVGEVLEGGRAETGEARACLPLALSLLTVAVTQALSGYPFPLQSQITPGTSVQFSLPVRSLAPLLGSDKIMPLFLMLLGYHGFQALLVESNKKDIFKDHVFILYTQIQIHLIHPLLTFLIFTFSFLLHCKSDS